MPVVAAIPKAPPQKLKDKNKKKNYIVSWTLCSCVLKTLVKMGRNCDCETYFGLFSVRRYLNVSAISTKQFHVFQLKVAISIEFYPCSARKLDVYFNIL
jgi:hypothetical protein